MGNGLSLLDAWPSYLRRCAKPSCWFPRCNSASGCKLDHGRLGPIHGPDMVDHRTRLDLATRRGVLRGAAEQFPRLISHGLHLLSVVRALSAGPFRQSRSIAVQLLASGRAFLWSVRGWKPSSRHSAAGTLRSLRSHGGTVEGKPHRGRLCRGIRFDHGYIYSARGVEAYWQKCRRHHLSTIPCLLTKPPSQQYTEEPSTLVRYGTLCMPRVKEIF